MPNLLTQETQDKLRTFAKQSLKGFHKSYKGWLTTYREKQLLRDTLKIALGWIIFLSLLFTYLYFINLASTKGYFMKVAQEELNAAYAKSDIIKLQIVAEKKENRENLIIPKRESIWKNLLTLEIPELAPKKTE